MEFEKLISPMKTDEFVEKYENNETFFIKGKSNIGSSSSSRDKNFHKFSYIPCHVIVVNFINPRNLAYKTWST